MKRGANFSPSSKKPNKRTRFISAQDQFFDAITNANEHTVEDMLNNRELFDVKVNAPNAQGKTALMIAASYKNEGKINYQYRILSALLNKGAHPNHLNAKGESAYDLAKRYKNNDAINALNSWALKDSSFENLSAENFKQILSYLPAYARVGNHAVNQVCRSWNENLKSNDAAKGEKSLLAILASCKTREDALNILRDEALTSQIPKKELLELISFDATLSQQIINKCTLDGLSLAILGKRDPVVAHYILNSYLLRTQLEITDWVKLGKEHLFVAQYLLKPSMFDSFMSGVLPSELNIFGNQIKARSTFSLQFNHETHHLLALGIAHPDIAQYLLDTPALLDRFSGRHLAILGKTHFFVAQHILNTPKILQKLLCDDVVILSKGDLAVAWHILETKALREKLGDAINHMGVSHVDIAWHLLKTPELRQNLEGRDLALMGKAHQEIARYILDTPELCNQLDSENIVAMAIAHVDIALHIIDMNEVCEKIYKRGWVCMGQANLDVAWFILDTPVWELEGKDLASLGEAHLDVAWHILNTPELCQRITYSDDFFKICEKHLPIAWHIINTPDLRAKLSPHDLTSMGMAHLPFARHIIKNLDLVDDVNRHKMIFNLAITHLEIARYVLSKRELYELIAQYIHHIATAHPSLVEEVLKNKALSVHLPITFNPLLQKICNVASGYIADSTIHPSVQKVVSENLRDTKNRITI